MFMQKICPRCGKATDKFYDGLCLKCYVETRKIIPESVEIKQCRECKKCFFRNKGFEQIEKCVELLLRKLLKNIPIEKVSFRVSSQGIIFLTLDKTEFRSMLRIKKFVCSSCKKKKVVQAVVQIRGDKKFTNKLLRLIKNEMKKSKDKTLKIVKSEIHKTGIDLHVSSKKGIRRVIKSLRKKYKLSVKISRKLVGVKDGSLQYKDFISVKEWEKDKRR